MTYRELESKDELLPLMDHAFRWTFNPTSFEKYVKLDPRLKNSPAGFCAVEDGHVVGYVGVMDLATRTVQGKTEYIGGVYGVATIPNHARKGISTSLMNRAHQHFRDKGYRFSLLGTSHTIVAHSLYAKLGYTDLFGAPSAYKILGIKKTKPVAKEKAAKLDYYRILRIYDECVKGKSGFVIRDQAHLKMLEKIEGLTGKHCMISDEGYLFFTEVKSGPWVSGIWMRELVALNAKEMNKLISLAEDKARDLIYDRAVMDSMLLQVYRSRGYMVEERSHSVMMVKPLTAEASFKHTYGARLYMTGLDFF